VFRFVKYKHVKHLAITKAEKQKVQRSLQHGRGVVDNITLPVQESAGIEQGADQEDGHGAATTALQCWFRFTAKGCSVRTLEIGLQPMHLCSGCGIYPVHWKCMPVTLQVVASKYTAKRFICPSCLDVPVVEAAATTDPKRGITMTERADRVQSLRIESEYQERLDTEWRSEADIAHMVLLERVKGSQSTLSQAAMIRRDPEDVVVHYKREMTSDAYWPQHLKGTSMVAAGSTYCVYFPESIKTILIVLHRLCSAHGNARGYSILRGVEDAGERRWSWQGQDQRLEVCVCRATR
jgi:hypothetical protein